LISRTISPARVNSTMVSPMIGRVSVIEILALVAQGHDIARRHFGDAVMKTLRLDENAVGRCVVLMV
jgi:hypothetical protein